MRSRILVAMLVCTCGFHAAAADAKGCLKGAAVGGVAGHVAGHHAVAGAAVGCVIGHHRASKKQKAEDAAGASAAQAG